MSKTLSKEDSYKFTKEQIVNSKKYVNRKDLLNAILKENELYSFSEVEDMINNFMKGVS
ncbi:putative phage protein [Clostridioides difficile CD160]|nr:putative phage protein [Clostridioides difficile CD160]